MSNLMQDVEEAIEEAQNVVEADVPAELMPRMSSYAKLENARRRLEDLLKAVKTKADSMQDEILEDMAMHGMENARVDGLTLYQRVDLFVSKKGGIEAQELCEQLRQCGCGYMVSDGYSASSLKAKVAEWKAEDVEVPPALAEMLNIGTKLRLVSRK